MPHRGRLIALGHPLALAVNIAQVELRLGISLFCGAFPSTKHLDHRAALGDRQPSPRTATALHELQQGQVKQEALLEELPRPRRKLRAAHGAHLFDAE